MHAGDGDRVADSPYSVKVVPGPPVARKSTVSGLGRMEAVVGEAANFIIEGRDQYGNRSVLGTSLLTLKGGVSVRSGQCLLQSRLHGRAGSVRDQVSVWYNPACK